MPQTSKGTTLKYTLSAIIKFCLWINSLQSKDKESSNWETAHDGTNFAPTRHYWQITLRDEREVNSKTYSSRSSWLPSSMLNMLSLLIGRRPTTEQTSHPGDIVRKLPCATNELKTYPSGISLSPSSVLKIKSLLTGQCPTVEQTLQPQDAAHLARWMGG